MKYAYANKQTTITGESHDGSVLVTVIKNGSFGVQVVSKGYDHKERLRLYGYRDDSGIEWSILESDCILNDVVPIARKIWIPNEEEQKKLKEGRKNNDGSGTGTGNEGDGFGSGEGFIIPLWAIGLVALLILR